MIKESSDNRWASFWTPKPAKEAMTLLAAWNAECFPNQLSLPAGLGAANGKIKIKFNTMYVWGEMYSQLEENPSTPPNNKSKHSSKVIFVI